MLHASEELSELDHLRRDQGVSRGDLREALRWYARWGEMAARGGPDRRGNRTIIGTPLVKVAAGEPKRFRVKVHLVNDELTIPLPEKIRAELDLQEGAELDMRIEPGRMTLTPLPRRPPAPEA